MHLSLLSQGEGGGQGWEWLLTLWPCPRVQIFDFSLSRGRAVLTVTYIPGRLGMSCFVSRLRRLLIFVQEEEVCNLIKSMRSSIHWPLFLTSFRQLRCEV